MADGGGLGVHAREERRGLLWLARGGCGVPCASRLLGSRYGAPRWPRYDEVWAAACDGCWPMAAHGRRGVAGVWHRVAWP
jgi:hypothetical protein